MAAGTHPALPEPWGPSRLFSQVPLPLPWMAAALLATYALVAVAVHLSSGSVAFASERGGLALLVFFELLQGALTVYLLLVTYLGRVGAQSDLEKLRDEVEGGPAEIETILTGALREPSAREWTVLAGATLGALAMVELDPALWADFPKPRLGSAAHLWAVARNTLVGWAVARLAFAEIGWTRAFVAAGRRVRVSLPKGAAHEPFVRKGLRSTMSWLVFSSLFSLFWLSGSSGTANPLLFTTALGFASAALLLPLRQLQRRIAEAKRLELQRVDDAIERAHARLFVADADSPSPMASLVAWRGLVEGVREWPISAPNLLRFALFVLLGLGSWLGGALVERGLDRFLD